MRPEQRAEKAWTAIKKILSSDQVTRLKGIELQIGGYRAVGDPEISKSLGITQSQQEKIRTLMQKQREANDSVRQKVEDGEIDQSQIRTAMQHNDSALNAAIGDILTSDQKAQIKSMKGKTFQREDQNFGG
jgi:hypothetical protein